MADVQTMFAQMSVDRKRIISNIIQLVYFMRGSVQYRDMIDMSQIEREAVGEFIEKRLEQESKKMHPNY